LLIAQFAFGDVRRETLPQMPARQSDKYADNEKRNQHDTGKKFMTNGDFQRARQAEGGCNKTHKM
jgi:hypothetical protein